MSRSPGVIAAWKYVAKWCREHPGTWALVKDDVSCSTSTHVRSGRLMAFSPPGTFEAIMRNTKGGRGTLYVRYIGENGEHRNPDPEHPDNSHSLLTTKAST